MNTEGLKEIHCSGCNKITGYLASGSKIAKGTVYTCGPCVKKAKDAASSKAKADAFRDELNKHKSGGGANDIFGDIFGGNIFGGGKGE